MLETSPIELHYIKGRIFYSLSQTKLLADIISWLAKGDAESERPILLSITFSTEERKQGAEDLATVIYEGT